MSGSWYPERVGDEARRELARFGSAGTMTELAAAWPEAVGEAIARNAWPARLGRDGTLHVATSSAAWAFELTQLAPAIEGRLRDRLGERAPGRLRFALGAVPEQTAAATVEKASRTVPEVRQEHRAAGDEIARGIADSELRELVARAAAASLAAAEEGPPGRGF